MSDLFNHASAILSECQQYRYTLTRTWDPALPPCFYVMLNPSTADADQDDPTIRRCITFAKRDGFGSLEVRNLFALRSPSPDLLRGHPDPVGPLNDSYLRQAVHAALGGVVVAAWGDEGNTLVQRRAAVVRQLFRPARAPLWCFGQTRGGGPRHPLYLERKTKVIPYVY